jgi:Flp pilus assembly protein TadD
VLAVLLAGPGIGAAPLPDAGRAAPDPTTHELAAAGAGAILAGNFPRAAQMFREASSIDPAFSEAQVGLAIAALGSGDWKGFDRAVRQAEALTHGSPAVRYLLAVRGWMADDMSSAAADARGAARGDPAFLEARYLLGLVEASRGDLPDAAETLREALHVDSTWAPLHFQLGAVLAAMGDLAGAVEEIRQALSIDAALEPDVPGRNVVFTNRRIPPGVGPDDDPALPLPVPRPAFIETPEGSLLLPAPDPAPVPEWFLDYVMAGFLEDGGATGPAARLLERALALDDREATRIPIGGRQVDYLPHRRLARVRLEAGDLAQARVHLDIARKQGATPADALGSLETLIKVASTKTRLVLMPLPDRTADEAVAIRGLIVTRDRPSWVDVGGQRALLRPATPDDLRAFPEEAAHPAAETGTQRLYFEVASYPLASLGPNSIRIRSGAAGAAGAEAEVMILREAPTAVGDARPAAGAHVGGSR